MECIYMKQLFPAGNTIVSDSSQYMINLYKYVGKGVYRDEKQQVFLFKDDTFVACGHCLPSVQNLKIDLHGVWKKDAHNRTSLIVSSFDDVYSKDKDGILSYLTSGIIKGIGPKTAKLIYDKFGNKSIDVLNENPEKLLKISGISKKKLEMIIASYKEFKGPQKAIMLLTPFGIQPKRAVEAFNMFGTETEDIIENHPYKLCKVPGFSFSRLDKSFRTKENFLSSERIDAALLYVLEQSEYPENSRLFSIAGNCCVEVPVWLTLSQRLLGGYVSSAEILKSAQRLIDERSVKVSKYTEGETKKSYAYLMHTAVAEHETAQAITELLKSSRKTHLDVSAEIEAMEEQVGFRLAPEQKNAVSTSLNNTFSVITGGPGTGKTTIVNFIRSIFIKNNPRAKVLLCAPTGRAASRMTESTGCSASTMHKMLGISPSTNGDYPEAEKLDCDLIIADEISMVDIFLAKTLFKAIRKGTMVVLVGDSNQLQSIGPGAVLHDIINSGVVPVARLTKVYRQGEQSLIFLNALDICNGCFKCDTGSDFQIIPTASLEDSAKIMKDIFLQEVAMEGVDNVTMLSPFRKETTATGVSNLNLYIHDYVNPPGINKKEVKINGTLFRTGDKVIQTKNVEFIANGDIGYILNIIPAKTLLDTKVKIDFGNERIVNYTGEDMENVNLAYATTVHKSQGSEYKTVILNIQKEHEIMLKKNLVYTAITRAKSKVIVVGDRFSLIKAARTENDNRCTLLAYRLKVLNNS